MGIYPSYVSKYNPALMRQNLKLKRQPPKGKSMTCSLLIKQYLHRAIWVVFAFIFMLVGCTAQQTNPAAKLTQPERVDYSFVFNVRDMPDVEILD